MPANDTNTTNQKATTRQRSDAAKVREGLTKVRNGTASYVRQTSERAIDVPVGAALVAADRVNGLVEPWTSTETRETEIKGLRQRVERELNRFERRGTGARRKTVQRARETRNRVERELTQRRQSVQGTVKENRVKVQDGLKKAQTAVQERVPVGSKTPA